MVKSPWPQRKLSPLPTKLQHYRLLLPTGARDLEDEELFLLRLTGDRLTSSAPLLRLAGGSERDEEGLRPLRRIGGERLTDSAARFLWRAGGERDRELE